MYINIIELLESIKEACEKQTSCNECPFLKDHYCSIYNTPGDWQIDSLRDPEILCNVSDFESDYIMEVEE